MVSVNRIYSTAHGKVLPLNMQNGKGITVLIQWVKKTTTTNKTYVFVITISKVSF